MLLKLILFFCFLPIPLILYFVLRNETKPKKNIILGVTLPPDFHQESAVSSVIRRFLRQQAAMLIGLLLLLLPQFLLHYDSYVMLWDMFWMIAALALPMASFAAANMSLKVLKRENGWYGEVPEVKPTDVKFEISHRHRMTTRLFMPAILLSLVPVVYTFMTAWGRDEFWVMLFVYLTLAALAGACLPFYRFIYRQKAETAGANADINAALTELRRDNWGICCLLTAWMTALYALCFLLFGANAAPLLISTFVYAVALLYFVLKVEFRVRKLQQKLTEGSGKTLYTDDDDHWPFGLFYFNPDDRHLIVNQRTGIGTTMNLAKTSAKILTAATVLLILAMPGLGFVMMHEEFTPVHLEASDIGLTATHTGTAYNIPFKEIESAELLEVLPEGTRTMGSAMATVLKGNFRFEGLGDCRLCLNPKVPPFIVVKTAERTYILGGSTREETLAAFALVERYTAKNTQTEYSSVPAEK